MIRESSLPSPNPKKTLVIACGALAHELLAVIRHNALEHVEIKCLPAIWHNTPEKITPGIRDLIVQHKDIYERILVAYGDCGTGGQLDTLLAEHAIERLPGEHCYSFFAGRQAFAEMAEAELGTFYLTDYLVDNFNRLILHDLGLHSHPELRDLYFANYTRVVYLCQSEQTRAGQDRVELAQAAANALALPLEIRKTGLEPFSQALKSIAIAAA
ncbi:MAG: DUF1638 domain-containing protein [Granulosicoccus sp.]